jgi:hypothetical protein
MPPPIGSRHPLIDAVDIPLWLENDALRDWQARIARDRGLAGDSHDENTDPRERVLHWWRQLGNGHDAPGPGREITALLRRLNLIMLVIGALSGGGLAGAVLAYDGSAPINVLVVLGWLVVLPLALLVISLALSLWSPDGREMHAGTIVLTFLQRRHAAAERFFGAQWSNRARDTLLRWALLRAAQLAGLAFACTALGVLLLRVGFSDLAFGWSTTLTIEPAQLATGIECVALPWSGWFADAVPSVELIEASRYFRLHNGSGALEAEALTAWWRFLAASLVVYGVLARMLALLVAHIGFRRATRHLLLAHSEVSALLDRLDTPLVTARADSAEAARAETDGAAPLFGGAEHADLVIYWNGAATMPPELSATLRLDAGDAETPAADLAALDNCTVPATGIVRIVTKAWEPPMLDFHDYLAALRAHVGDGVTLVVQPLDEAGGRPVDADLMVWRRNLARLSDARLYVR